MSVLEDEHARHGSRADHLVADAAAGLGVSVTTVEGKYNEHLRRRESMAGVVVLDSAEKAAIVSTRSFTDAQRTLAAAGRCIDFALLERAIWRDGGDRALAALRGSERERRIRSLPCVCGPLVAEAAA